MKICFIGGRNVENRVEYTIFAFLRDGHRIFFLDPLYYFPKSSKKKHYLFQRLFGKIAFFVNSFFIILFSDVVYVLPLNQEKTWLIKTAHLFSKTIIGEFYASIYDNYFLEKKNRPRRKEDFYLWKEREYLDYCEKLIFLNSNEVKYYHEILGKEIVENKIVVSPVFCQDRGLSKLPFFHNEESVARIAWWGIESPLHGIHTIIEAAKSVTIHYPCEFHFFLPVGTDKTHLSSLISSDLLGTTIFFHNDASFQNGLLTDFLNCKCDIALGIFGITAKAQNVLVNKIIESSSFGLPCITRMNNATSIYFKDEENIIFSDTKVQSLVNSLERLIENKERAIRIGREGRNIYEKYFTEANYYKTISELVKGIENKKSANK